MTRLLLLVLCTFIAYSVAGQIDDPVRWSFDSKKISDTEYELYFDARVDEGWYLYSQHLKSGGPVPTSFNFDNIKGAELSGKVEEVGKLESKFDDLFGMDLKYYKHNVRFKQRVKVKNGASGVVKGYLEYMSCNNAKCLPPKTVDYSFSLASANNPTPPPTPANSSIVVTSIKTTPSPSPTSTTKPTATTKPAPVATPTSSSTPTATQTPSKPATLTGAGGMGKPLAQPVKWKTEIKAVEGKTDEFDIVSTATIDKGWGIYSVNTKDDGPIATSLTLTSKNTQKVGKTTESGHSKSGYDAIFGMKITKFTDNMKLTQRVKVKDGNPIKGYVEYQACDATKCLPPTTVEFSFKQPTPKTAAGTPTTEPATVPQNSTTTTTDTTSTASTELVQEPTSTNDAAGTTAAFANYPTIGKTPVNSCSEQPALSNLWMIFIWGFLGGLVALLTPCVFPMIPLTVSYFTKKTRSKTEGLSKAVIYGISIVIIYVSLGLLLTGLFGPQVMNELATNPILNIFFFLMLIVFAASFFGYFEITLPSTWANKTDQMAERSGLVGIFFMAFTLGIVSFSCTGPIIGTLLVQAATNGSRLGPAVGMFGFSLALALPFTLFAAFPQWLQSLPKSGSWMNTVKVVLGFLELALAFKFLSVVDMTYHLNFLKYELFLALWIIIFLGLTLYLFGLIRFPHDSPLTGLSKSRLGLGLVSLLFSIYLATGLTYKPLYLLSGLAPPVHYNFFRPMECPHGIDCFKDLDKALTHAKEQKKPLLLDFTGYGCVNCRKMEEHVWPDPSVLKKLREEFVLVSLYVDDRTKLDEPYVSAFDGQMKRNIGNKWADYQAINFNANSQPYYVLISADGQLLNEPAAYTPDKKAFDSFLECGLNAYYGKVCTECVRGAKPAGGPVGMLMNTRD
jgi:thiol:disulfide interchange protein